MARHVHAACTCALEVVGVDVFDAHKIVANLDLVAQRSGAAALQAYHAWQAHLEVHIQLKSWHTMQKGVIKS